jgi:hypothetical protein
MKMEAQRLGLVEDVALVVSELDGVSGETGLGSLVPLTGAAAVRLLGGKERKRKRKKRKRGIEKELIKNCFFF